MPCVQASLHYCTNCTVAIKILRDETSQYLLFAWYRKTKRQKYRTKNIAIRWRPFYSTVSYNFTICRLLRTYD